MEHAVIDRFEGAYAVLLVGDEQRSLNVRRAQLPRHAREGHWLTVEIIDSTLVSAQIDESATQAARQRIQEKLARLRRGDHLKDR